MSKGVLMDLTRCVGCGSCAVACKMWNNLPYTEDAPHTGRAAQLNDRNWTIVAQKETNDKEGQPVWRYVKHQCMHCLEPACVSACFSRALQRDQNGAIVYIPSLCVGCRYCMVACPFDIPKYEWHKSLPLVTKCQLCADKLSDGEAPACVGVCPTGALLYGERADLLKEAKSRIAGGGYVQHVYGEHEVGGTAWLYLSDVPFTELGFPAKLGERPLPSYTRGFISQTPWLAAGWGTFLVFMSWYTRRRHRVNKKDDSSKKEKQRDEHES